MLPTMYVAWNPPGVCVLGRRIAMCIVAVVCAICRAEYGAVMAHVVSKAIIDALGY